MSSLPGNTALPTSEADLQTLAAQETGQFKYQVEDFFRKPAVSAMRLSPDGTWVSFKKRNDQGKTDIWLRHLDSGQEKCLLVEKEDLIRSYFWLNPTQIIYTQDKGGDENYHLFLVDVNSGETEDLTPFEGVRAGIEALIDDNDDELIISLNRRNPALFEPYRINVKTKEMTRLMDNEDVAQPLSGFLFDRDGDLRGYAKVLGIDVELFYRVNNEFQLLCSLPFSDTFEIQCFDYKSGNPDIAYVTSNLDSDCIRFERRNLATNELLEVIYENDTYDCYGGMFSRHRNYELDGIVYVGDREHIVEMSPTMQSWHDDLERQLRADIGDGDIDIIGATRDESKLLVAVSSDRVVGRTYLYISATKTLTLINTLLPHLHFEDMAYCKPITFTSRDGLTIHGYITLPNNIPVGEKVPLIVVPHGGPQGIRDYWGFNPEAQLFASRGYATLFVNFRISGGYGKKFYTAGFGQVGRKCMDDVEDGIDYVLQHFPIHADKVAIYGGSHGGYAVLRGMTKTPERYACGVDYVGVANLFTFMQTTPPYWLPYKEMIKKYWYDEDKPEERKIMEEVSPVLHIDQFAKPLFVVQGANDPRVNINEADQIVEGLRARGIDVPYMVKYDEGHGFGKESNRLELYKCMMGFFSQHLK